MSPDAIVAAAIARASTGTRDRPLVVGLCGAQGSGKSTLAAALVDRFPRAVGLSLDDLYLRRAERRRLAAEVHPLLATRGVPGTHDVALGLRTLAAIDRGETVALPRFDKAQDDRLDAASWPIARAGCGLVVLDGWCVGARPQCEEALDPPVNRLERERDPDGRWRRGVNAALAGPYQALFARIDMLVLLRAPRWEQVFAWRLRQEEALRRSRPDGPAVMDAAAIATFVSHYERLTRHIMTEMPSRADLTLALDADRNCVGVTVPDRKARP